MTDFLIVIIDDTIAGRITKAAGGRLRFDYVDEYQARRAPTPLSLSMPTQVRSHSDHLITPWLRGLLPDNEDVLARWGRQFQVSASSPFSLLGTPIGEDCAGAVRFARPENINRALERSGEVTWITDDDVAQRLRELREDSAAWLGRTFTGQFSLAGAQAKTALLYQDGRWGVPSGSTPTTHILKPAVTGFDDHDLNEHICLDSARRAGLIAARTRVASFGDERAVVVDRYDRRPTAHEIARVHQEDVCQALSVPPSGKYQSEDGPGPRAVAGLLRRVMSPRVADDAVWRFADALIWNWIIAGTDAHAKNYSLLLSNDQVRLAPMYDVASALPYGIHEKKLRLAMKIGGDYEVFPHRNTWPAAAQDLGLSADKLIDRVRELAAAAPDCFADAAQAPAVAALGCDLPARLTDFVANRAARCVQMLDSGSDSSGPASLAARRGV
jgi:serine/threonine-protein kinase HipA